MNISVQVIDTINKINAEKWDGLSAGRPFQSHTWYKFGEHVMVGNSPVYLLAYQNNELIGRLALWVTRNEPLPQSLGYGRVILRPILQKWPLCICRSPIAQTSGLVVSGMAENPNLVIEILIRAAIEQGRKYKCLALLFDYLGSKEKEMLPIGIHTMQAADSGNILYNTWEDFDQYLARGDKKARRHYHRTLREIDGFRVRLERKQHAENMAEILPLVRNVEKQHGAPQNPWIENLLRSMEMVNGTFLTASSADDKLVGCMLFLEDGTGQIATGFGRQQDLPYVYLGLFYEGIRIAMEHGIKFLRWGSGAFELKRRMGFTPEDNGIIAFTFLHPVLQKLSNKFIHSIWS